MIQLGKKQYIGIAFMLLGVGFLFFNWYSRVPEPAEREQVFTEADYERWIEDLACDRSLLDQSDDDAYTLAQERVSGAYYRLTSARKKAFPTLIRHMNDGRFSHRRAYSRVMDTSVGESCKLIIDNQIDPRGISYKGRKAPGGFVSGARVLFDYYARNEFGGYKQWWEANKNLTLLEMRVKFCKWRIAQERKAGFASEQQKEDMELSFKSMYAEASTPPAEMPWPPPENYAVDWGIWQWKNL